MHFGKRAARLRRRHREETARCAGFGPSRTHPTRRRPDRETTMCPDRREGATREETGRCSSSRFAVNRFCSPPDERVASCPPGLLVSLLRTRSFAGAWLFIVPSGSKSVPDVRPRQPKTHKGISKLALHLSWNLCTLINLGFRFHTRETRVL